MTTIKQKDFIPSTVYLVFTIALFLTILAIVLYPGSDRALLALALYLGF